MNKLLAVLIGGLLVSGAASAGVYFQPVISVGVPAPVYVQPAPVYVQPVVYTPAPVAVAPVYTGVTYVAPYYVYHRYYGGYRHHWYR